MNITLLSENQDQTDVVPRWMWIVAIFLVPGMIGAGLWYWYVFPKEESDAMVRMRTSSVVQMADLAACDAITRTIDGVNYQTVCRNNIFLKRATERLDFAVCKNMDDKLILISDCESAVMNALLQKETGRLACQKVPAYLTAACIDASVTLSARKEKDIDLCRSATNAAAELACEYATFLALAEQEEKLPCDSLKSAPLKNDCRAYVERVCEAISDRTLAQLCRHASTSNNDRPQ